MEMSLTHNRQAQKQRAAGKTRRPICRFKKPCLTGGFNLLGLLNHHFGLFDRGDID
jgi:hypothetical protein